MKVDVLIRGAEVHDGNGGAGRRCSVGFAGGRIALVGDEGPGLEAVRTIEAFGLVLAPGFIDTHASTGLGYTLPAPFDNKLHQGVTTEIIGNCGTSVAPIGEGLEDELQRQADQMGFTFDWRTLAEWIEMVEAHGLGINVGTFVGHSTLRGGVAQGRSELTDVERHAMVEMLDDAMKHGALGLSTGLIYAPGSFAETEEIVELAAVVARHGGIYVSHIRDERFDLESAVAEALEVGERAGLRVLISHLKSAERPNWGKIQHVIETVEAARAAGGAVTFEVYPYTAVSTKLRAFIPKSMLEGGTGAMIERLRSDDGRRAAKGGLHDRATDFEAMLLITESLPGARGSTVADLARARRVDAFDLAVDVLLADPDAWVVYTCLSQADVDTAVLWPDSNIVSDSWSYPVNAANSIGDPHPRTYGAFTRFLEQYVIERGLLDWGEAIRKITSLPADVCGLLDRGRIEPGRAADLVLLDPGRVHETATFTAPRQLAEGTVHVWVNGVHALEDGRVTGATGGVVNGRRT